MQILHPDRKKGNLQHFNLSHIAGRTRNADISKDNVIIAAVISHIKDSGVLRNIFFSLYNDLYTGKADYPAEGPVDNGKGASAF